MADGEELGGDVGKADWRSNVASYLAAIQARKRWIPIPLPLPICRSTNLSRYGRRLLAAPRTDPSERHYRTRLAPWVMTLNRASGSGCRRRSGGSE